MLGRKSVTSRHLIPMPLIDALDCRLRHLPRIIDIARQQGLADSVFSFSPPVPETLHLVLQTKSNIHGFVGDDVAGTVVTG